MRNLTDFDRTINHALAEANVIEKLGSCKTINDIAKLVSDACENITGEETIKKRDELLKTIRSSRNLARANSAVINFYLKGEGLGVIHDNYRLY